MANVYLVVSNAKSYLCKSTHTGTPYIKVSNSYLDLAETTTSGTQIKFQIGTKTYRPKQTYTTTSSRQSDYISTSGYSGVSSKKSISKYSGVSYYSGGISYSTVSETKASSSTRPLRAKFRITASFFIFAMPSALIMFFVLSNSGTWIVMKSQFSKISSIEDT